MDQDLANVRRQARLAPVSTSFTARDFPLASKSTSERNRIRDSELSRKLRQCQLDLLADFAIRIIRVRLDFGPQAGRQRLVLTDLLDAQRADGWILDLTDDDVETIGASLLDQPLQNRRPTRAQCPVRRDRSHPVAIRRDSKLQQRISHCKAVDRRQGRIEVELIEQHRDCLGSHRRQ